MKFSSLAILGLLFSSSSLTLAQNAPASNKPSPGCMSALMNLVSDDAFEKCLPIGAILNQDQGSSAIAYIENFKGIPDEICPSPVCPDSLIKDKVNTAANNCTNEIQALGMTLDQVDAMVLTLYKDIRQLLCFMDSHNHYCVDVSADTLHDYANNNQIPPSNVLCTPCIKAIYIKSKEILTLVAKSPIGAVLSLNPDKILPPEPMQSVCGAPFINGTIPDTTAGNTTDGNSTSGGSSGTGGSSGGSSGTGGSSGGSNGTSGNSTSSKTSAASSSRMDYILFGVLVFFVALW